MVDNSENYYKICRKLASLTQEQAAPLLGVEPRTLSLYENGGKVPDDIVNAMAENYNAPLLAIWHLKNNSPLGKWLPNVFKTETNNDLGFQTVLAKKDALAAENCILEILTDGVITEDEVLEVESYEKYIDAAIGKYISAKAYTTKIKNGFHNA